MLDNSVKTTLNNMCREHGFVSRGKTFFRIYGEAILQVIGFRYQRVESHYSLQIGLMSMYSEADNDAFSAGSFLPKYSICCMDNCANAVAVGFDGSMTTFSVRNPESQLELLISKGFDWLNSITTQKQLLDAIRFLDNVTYKVTIWNDVQKLAPYLALGDFSRADYVIASILNQNLGPESITPPPWSEKDFLYFTICRPNRNDDLLYVHKLIAEKQEDAIKAYLERNYCENLKRLPFHLRKTKA